MRTFIGNEPPTHCEPSICRSTPSSSSMMAETLMHRGSGITTGSYRAAGGERLSASSSSHRALVSFARTLLLRSWPNISLPSWGKKGYELLHDGSRCARCHSVRRVTVFRRVRGMDADLSRSRLCVTRGRCDVNHVLRVWLRHCTLHLRPGTPTQPLPAAKSAAESAYLRFGVNFDIREFMSSSTP
jgi:hypothetical protein